MTETAFQAARKVMQKANYLRGLITSSIGDVAKWTKIEAVHRENGAEGQANGAKKCLDAALKRLQERRAKFAALIFPDPNLTEEELRCKDCGRKLKPNEDCICIYE